MEMILEYVIGLVKSLPYGVIVLSVLGTLDIIGTFIVKATKSAKDDEKLKELQDHKVWGPLLKALEKFSYVDLIKK